jgi:hypothetical protein
VPAPKLNRAGQSLEWPNNRMSETRDRAHQTFHFMVIVIAPSTAPPQHQVGLFFRQVNQSIVCARFGDYSIFIIICPEFLGGYGMNPALDGKMTPEAQ